MADQEKTWIVRHPHDPNEVRTVTQRDWIAGKLTQKGFTKPDDLDDTADIGPVPPAGPPITLQQK